MGRNKIVGLAVIILLIGILGLAGNEKDRLNKGQDIAKQSMSQEAIERLQVKLPVEEMLENKIIQYLKREEDDKQELPILLEEYECGEVVDIGAVELTAQITGDDTIDYEVEVLLTRKAYPREEMVATYPYLYPKEVLEGQDDRVRAKEKYWITIDKITGEQVRAESAREAKISRIAFEDNEALSKIAERIKNGMRDLLDEPLVFFDTYKEYLKEDVGLARKHLERGLTYPTRFTIDEDLLIQTYPGSLNPFEIGEQVSIDWKTLEVIPSIYSTQKQPRFDVSIKVSLLINHYNKVYYKYNYFVGTEEGKIKWIQPKAVEMISP